MADREGLVKGVIAAEPTARQDGAMDDTQTPPKHSVWRAFMREWGPRAVFESVLIVFSIVLALALSNWALSMQTEARVREARAYFVQELRANRAILVGDDIIPHHRRLHGIIAALNFDSPISLATAAPAREALFETGIHVAPLRDVVWQTYSGNELMEHIPPQVSFALNDAYRAQQQLAELQNSYYPVLSQLPAQMMTSQDLRGPLISLQLHLGDLIGSEENLLARYDAALRALGEQR